MTKNLESALNAFAAQFNEESGEIRYEYRRPSGNHKCWTMIRFSTGREFFLSLHKLNQHETAEKLQQVTDMLKKIRATLGKVELIELSTLAVEIRFESLPANAPTDTTAANSMPAPAEEMPTVTQEAPSALSPIATPAPSYEYSAAMELAFEPYDETNTEQAAFFGIEVAVSVSRTPATLPAAPFDTRIRKLPRGAAYASWRLSLRPARTSP